MVNILQFNSALKVHNALHYSYSVCWAQCVQCMLCLVSIVSSPHFVQHPVSSVLHVAAGSISHGHTLHAPLPGAVSPARAVTAGAGWGSDSGVNGPRLTGRLVTGGAALCPAAAKVNTARRAARGTVSGRDVSMRAAGQGTAGLLTSGGEGLVGGGGVAEKCHWSLCKVRQRQ